MLNSLNMKFSIKEKLQLIQLADPLHTRLCDIDMFIKKVTKNTALSTRGVEIILEKFSTALFYNDMSIN